MQSASAERRLALDPEMMLERLRARLGGGMAVSAVIVLILTFAVAKSTATADWVPGIDVIVLVAVAGAVAMSLLAILPVPWAGALALGLLAGPVLAAVAAWPVIHAAHPLDPLDSRLIGIWAARIADGSAASDPSLYLFLITWLMWVSGVWLSWCVLRWRKPMLGLIPGAAAFATNLLNFPADQNGYTLAILVLTLALLLWSNYTSSIVSADRAHVKLTGDARWDFWESGLVAMAGLIVLGIMLPPLSTVDKTTDVESGAFSRWAQLQQQLSHPGLFDAGKGGGAGTTGFSSDVKLSGPLQRTRDIAFTYTVVGDYAGPRYFRGLDETVTLAGEWRFPSGSGFHETIPKSQVPLYGEDYQRLAVAGFDVRMVRPPVGNSDLLFYPSEFYKVNRVTLASQVPLPPSSSTGLLISVDRLQSLQPSTSAGTYDITSEYSTATTAELQAAGNNYPDWIPPYYTSLPEFGYRPSGVIDRIHVLALDVVRQAGLDPATASPYDMATAVEAYLRSDRFTYTLSPPDPGSADTIDYFLFTSHRGYCEYFATAMGDMLRSLGIPTRLVNGFGPGQFDSSINSYVVRGEDAHTWVEVYFPNYGWIPFEPTNDNVYQTITRGASGSALCLRDNNCTDPSSAATAGAGGSTQVTPKTGSLSDPAIGTGGGGLRVSGITVDANLLTRVAAIFVALLLLLFAVVARYLRPRSVMAVWKRVHALSRLAGAQRRPGETPLELGRRLQRTFPEAAEPVGALARAFVVAAYAPPDLASTSRVSVMEAWSSLRPLLLRRVFARLRPTRL